MLHETEHFRRPQVQASKWMRYFFTIPKRGSQFETKYLWINAPDFGYSFLVKVLTSVFLWMALYGVRWDHACNKSAGSCFSVPSFPSTFQHMIKQWCPILPRKKIKRRRGKKTLRDFHGVRRDVLIKWWLCRPTGIHFL